MIIHASIPADDPERVARIIAELWRGTYARSARCIQRESMRRSRRSNRGRSPGRFR